MYTIIGGDGKEYGPVSIEQVRGWVAAGRANLSTKVKEAGSDAWKTISDCPEITGSASTAGVGRISAALVADRAASLDIMSCLGRSWTLLKADAWPLLGVSFLVTVIYAAASFVLGRGLYFAGGILGSVFGAGLFNYFLLKVRGKPAAVGDAFAGFSKRFLTLVGIGLLFSIFVSVGLCLLVIPGVYLFVAYVFAPVLAVDKGLGYWDAMETSRRVVTRSWWRVAGLVLLIIALLALGTLALGVGIFVAIPLAAGAIAYAYEDLCGPGR
jgi:uncharacterized protein DUF4339